VIFITTLLFCFSLVLFISYFVGSGWFFSTFLLYRMIDPIYCMAMVLIALKVYFRVDSGNLSLISKSFIEGACVVPLALAVITISGSTFHP